MTSNASGNANANANGNGNGNGSRNRNRNGNGPAGGGSWQKEFAYRGTQLVKQIDTSYPTDDHPYTPSPVAELLHFSNSLYFLRDNNAREPRIPTTVRIRNKYLLNHTRIPSVDSPDFEKPSLQPDLAGSVPASPSLLPANIPVPTQDCHKSLITTTAPSIPSHSPTSPSSLLVSPYNPPQPRVAGMLNRISQPVSSSLSMALSQGKRPASTSPLASNPPTPSDISSTACCSKVAAELWPSNSLESALDTADRLGLGLLHPSATLFHQSVQSLDSDELSSAMQYESPLPIPHNVVPIPHQRDCRGSLTGLGHAIPIASTPGPSRPKSRSISLSDSSLADFERRPSNADATSPFTSNSSPNLYSQDLKRTGSLKITVKKRDSMQYGSTPILQGSVNASAYSSITPSPAVSFLSGLADRMNSMAPLDGVYREGDQVGEYTLVKQIGTGAFSTVFEAVTVADPSKTVAIKVICKEQRDMPPRNLFRLIEHEVWIWRPLRHPHIVAMLDILEADDALFIVSELAKVSAVKYLHEVANIVHRDIKCENILLATLDPPHALLTDFGLSEYIPPNASTSPTMDISGGGSTSSPTSTTSPSLLNPNGSATSITSLSSIVPPDAIFCAGSLHYCAPEELRASPGTNPRSPIADVWSMGCVLYAMLAGQLPFGDTFLPRLQMSIINGRYDEKRLREYGVSRDAEILIKGMLTVKSESRWTLSQVCSSAWVQGSDFDFVSGLYNTRRISSVSIDLSNT
ncbi:hypothetical protein SeMB42_g04526 [Synchytrium endobioticum]|uniref:Protein kinase domain-containing protein n=1 Tax=Synchytrium endobioticum TaxID=286115 RepID=A0A507CXH3_9FUNG|nr:hypothetical protein SeMB42_g04526 [Synchytrium endobioticum]